MDRVPRSPASSTVAQPSLSLSVRRARPTSRAVVLVVDDDAGVREALHLILDDEYSVLDAAHGRTALSIARAQRLDLVLLDILMPGTDGIEILQELKALEPDLPVIMMTAVKTVLTSVAAMKLGACDYITKPFRDEELVASIRRALEGRENRFPARAERAQQDHVAQLSRSHRLLVVGGDLGWRATLSVALARVGAAETAPTFIEGLNRLIRFRPTGVILHVGQASLEAVAFVRALHAQLPACPVLVISDDGCLGGVSEAWETLNIRGVLQPPVDFGDLMSRIGVMVVPGIVDTCGAWPRLGPSASQALHWISSRFAESLTVATLAQVTDVSPSHFAHLFRAEIGLSVRNYLTRVRVSIAQDLLTYSDDKLEAIAARVGFGDMFHLSRVFQRVTGRPPSTYRRSVS